MSMANDYFGLFDLCCKRKGLTWWIQVKYGSKTNVYSAKRDIEDFDRKYCGESESCFIALRVPRKGWVMYSRGELGFWEKTYHDLNFCNVESFTIGGK